MPKFTVVHRVPVPSIPVSATYRIIHQSGIVHTIKCEAQGKRQCHLLLGRGSVTQYFIFFPGPSEHFVPAP